MEKSGKYNEFMMRRDMLQTSAVVIPEPETEDFSWDFLLVPRSKIEKKLAIFRDLGGFEFKGLQFKTGFLADTDHHWKFALFGNQINIFMVLPPTNRNNRYHVLEAKLQFLAGGEVRNTHILTFRKDELTHAPRILWTAHWTNSDLSWNDDIETMRVIFRIKRESAGKTVHSFLSPVMTSRNLGILEATKHVDCSDFFKSDFLSDVTLECKGKEFPAHKFLLSCRSPVFNRMFRTKMKEAEEGRVIIEDMEPEVLEEMLRFMYLSEFSTSAEDIWMELFEAADRFDVAPLKARCEHEMLAKVRPENALAMYMTAELHDAKLLKQKAYDIINLNKEKVFRDRTAFKVFVTKYPDIAYELFNSIV